MKRNRIYWACQIGGWGLLATVNLALARVFAASLSGKFAIVYLAAAAWGITLTHAYRGIIRRRRWLDLPIARSAATLFAASVGLAIMQTAGLTAVFAVVRIPGTFQGWGWAPAAVVFWTVQFVLWSAIYAAVHYFRRTRQAELDAFRLELSAREAELHALHGQINPHFLFNSLNSLRALIHEDPERATRMVTELAKVLRYSLQSGRSQTVTLQAELESVGAYLALESIRFEDRLRVQMEVAPELASTAIPPMLVQMLVENAIKYGVERQNQTGEIHVSAHVEGNRLRLQVTNPGRLGAASEGNGVGLTNARQRLRLLFGENSRLELAEQGGLVTVSASWPIFVSSGG